jgi:hypothetical protein
MSRPPCKCDAAQAKNVVLNVSEMEAKVREATNDDPWCVLLLRVESEVNG